MNFALAVVEVERTLKNVGNYKSALFGKSGKRIDLYGECVERRIYAAFTGW